MDTSKKAKRELYTSHEKMILFELIRERLSILECKEINKVAITQKQAAFAAITELFNSSTFVDTKRSVKQIRAWYKSNKKANRHKFAKFRQKNEATGNCSSVRELSTGFKDRLVDRHLVALPRSENDDSDVIFSELLFVESPDEADVIIPDVSTPPLSLCDELSTDTDFQRNFQEDYLDSTRSQEPRNEIPSKKKTASLSKAIAAATIEEENTYQLNVLTNAEKRIAEEHSARMVEHAARLKLLETKQKFQQLKSQDPNNGISSNKETAPSSKANADTTVEEEKKFQLKILANAEKRLDEEHAARMLEHAARLKLLEAKQKVQEQFLDYLTSSPSCLNITFK